MAYIRAAPAAAPRAVPMRALPGKSDFVGAVLDLEMPCEGASDFAFLEVVEARSRAVCILDFFEVFDAKEPCETIV